MSADATPVAGQATVAASALAEPATRARGPLLATLALANLGIMIAFYAPLQQLLPRLSETVAGAGGKEAALAVITGVGVIGAVVGQPVVGALSDRTTSRWGRRRPWLLGGAVAGAAVLVILPGLGSVAAIAICWLAAQVMINSSYAAVTATIPDQVPVTQRGVASGLMGLAQTLGIVLGVVLVARVVTGLSGGFLLAAVLLLLLVLPFLLVLKDRPLTAAERPATSAGEFLRGFWVSPRAHPDFAWAWIARFAVQLGNSITTIYLLFFLQDRIGLSKINAQETQSTLLVLYAAGTILTAVGGGYFSDRSGKRKAYVIAATLIMAIASLLIAWTRTMPLIYLAAPSLGIGYGWYMAVDQALVTQVLPTARDRARDLGVINIANSAPQVLAPVIALICVKLLGGYPTLYLVAAVIGLLGAAAIVPIKSVR